MLDRNFLSAQAIVLNALFQLHFIYDRIILHSQQLANTKKKKKKKKKKEPAHALVGIF
jgi:hypothetical protein